MTCSLCYRLLIRTYICTIAAAHGADLTSQTFVELFFQRASCLDTTRPANIGMKKRQQHHHTDDKDDDDNDDDDCRHCVVALAEVLE